MGFRGVENGAEGMRSEEKSMTMNDKGAGKTECFLGISDPFRILLTQRITRPGLEPGTTEPKSVVLPLHHRVTWTSAESVVAQADTDFAEFQTNFIQ